MTFPGRRLAAMATAVVAALALAACGVPVSDSPHALSKSDVPPPPPPTTSTTFPSGYLPYVVVWLNATDGAAPQQLFLPKSARLSTVLGTLLSGDTGSGFFTLIPSQTTLVGISPDVSGPFQNAAAPAGPITVNLSDQFLNIGGTSQEILAVEQVVFTLACNLTPADKVAVTFEVEGDPQAVPIGNGTTVDGPVTAADYGTLDCTPSSS